MTVRPLEKSGSALSSHFPSGTPWDSIKARLPSRTSRSLISARRPRPGRFSKASTGKSGKARRSASRTTALPIRDAMPCDDRTAQKVHPCARR